MIDKLGLIVQYEKLHVVIMERKEMMDVVISFFPFFQGKENMIKEKIKSLHDLEDPLFPNIVDKEKKVKKMERWKTRFDLIVHMVMIMIANGGEIKMGQFNTTLGKVLIFEVGYDKFIKDARAKLDARWR